MYYQHKPESEGRSTHWFHPTLAKPEKVKITISTGKIVAQYCFWDLINFFLLIFPKKYLTLGQLEPRFPE